jgi:hypothetical protein
VVRLFSIATMVTVSSRPRPAILEEEEIWAPSVQATDRELFTFEPCCSPGGFADCVWAMIGVADRRVKDGRCPSVDDLTH